MTTKEKLIQEFSRYPIAVLIIDELAKWIDENYNPKEDSDEPEEDEAGDLYGY